MYIIISFGSVAFCQSLFLAHSRWSEYRSLISFILNEHVREHDGPNINTHTES